MRQWLLYRYVMFDIFPILLMVLLQQLYLHCKVDNHASKKSLLLWLHWLHLIRGSGLLLHGYCHPLTQHVFAVIQLQYCLNTMHNTKLGLSLTSGLHYLPLLYFLYFIDILTMDK